MLLTNKEVEHVAVLARLTLTDAEKDKFRHQLSSVLEYVAAIGRVPTDDVPPTMHAVRSENVLREDKVEGCDAPTRQDILKNAPERNDNLYRVPPVFG